MSALNIHSVNQNLNLVKFKPEFSNVRDVMAVIEDNGSHLVLTHPDDLSETRPGREIASLDVVDILPLSLSFNSSTNEYRAIGSGADDNPDVEIYLVSCKQNNNHFDIVRRCDGQSAAVLTDGSLRLGKACNVLAACNAIDWQCLVSNTGDIETVCVSNAVAIIETFEGQKKLALQLK